MKSLFYKLFPSRKKRRQGVLYVKRSKLPADSYILVITLMLSVLGILMIYESSVAIAIRDFSDQYYFVKEQIKWLGIGFIAFFVMSKIDYHLWKKAMLPLLISMYVLLTMVFIPGLSIEALGAKRWIDFVFFVLQPTEFVKLALVLYLSVAFSQKKEYSFVNFVILVSTILSLIVAEPDLGAAVLIGFIALVMYFLSGAPLKNIFIFIPVFAVAVIVLAIASPYRMERVSTFLNIEKDPLGSSYQIRQILVALGSGGLFGKGLGKSRQKLAYLPEANTDSIFAIIAEELGFIGSMVLIVLFFLLIWRGFKIAKTAPDKQGQLLALGISSWIGMQTCMNLAAMVALIPLTGITLPLVSYGGSSLIIILSSLGVLANISKYRKKL